MTTPVISGITNDKTDAFNKMQIRFFGKYLAYNEPVYMTREQLQMICDEMHEYGRIRERADKPSTLRFH